MVYISCIEVYQGSSEAIPDIVSANVARARLTRQDTESQGPRVVYPQLARLAGAQVLNSFCTSSTFVHFPRLFPQKIYVEVLGSFPLGDFPGWGGAGGCYVGSSQSLLPIDVADF